MRADGCPASARPEDEDRKFPALPVGAGLPAPLQARFLLALRPLLARSRPQPTRLLDWRCQLSTVRPRFFAVASSRRWRCRRFRRKAGRLSEWSLPQPAVQGLPAEAPASEPELPPRRAEWWRPGQDFATTFPVRTENSWV